MLTKYTGYNTLPDYPLVEGQILEGYTALARYLVDSGFRFWTLDGMSGVAWSQLQAGLRAALSGMQIYFLDVTPACRSCESLRSLLADSLDNDDSVFGRLYEGTLLDFFLPEELSALREQALAALRHADLVICYGRGSAFLRLAGGKVWVDLPKEQITALATAGQDVLLGTSVYPALKSLYWVDWPVMEQHKTRMLPTLDLFVDFTSPDEPRFLEGPALRTTLSALSRQPFRVKPVFYPGAWGGQWMKGYMHLDPNKPNYAWSYELITPENGILFHDGKLHLEVPFELLMAHETLNVQGPGVAERFGASFPLRFNYDDTLAGGNLSCQVHPRTEYMRREFGLPYTQDETYYILKAGEQGLCYLGVQDDIDPQKFRVAAEQARDAGVAFDTETFVNAWPTRMHDLFLIPAGTVHNSGANNVVLEISSTPYLYTFKIYDYLRRDLNGKLRPIHIERAWENIDFTRRTTWVRQNLLPSPRLLRQGEGWTEYIIGEHPLLFFAIHRVEFGDQYEDDTA
ncbi:MAG TPA: class I mannose-6-phosphate isomerase, partial [Ktedonobacteraceae bacterium]|nr:class I mannose-6-phosphate isomerase [Ktedonobacteraceae bacterium]